MELFIPRNTFDDLWAFFSIPQNPIQYQEMMEFWASLPLKEKHYYMCQDLAA